MDTKKAEMPFAHVGFEKRRRYISCVTATEESTSCSLCIRKGIFESMYLFVFVFVHVCVLPLKGLLSI